MSLQNARIVIALALTLLVFVLLAADARRAEYTVQNGVLLILLTAVLALLGIEWRNRGDMNGK